MKKKMLFCLLTSLILTSCTKNPSVEPSVQQTQEPSRSDTRHRGRKCRHREYTSGCRLQGGDSVDTDICGSHCICRTEYRLHQHSDGRNAHIAAYGTHNRCGACSGDKRYGAYEAFYA